MKLYNRNYITKVPTVRCDLFNKNNHSHKKGKDSQEDSLDRVLFVAELEFPKILVPRLFYFLFNIKRQGLVKPPEFSFE